jgi:eukaryotic-like serine/threonine-protein kinase
VSSTDPNRWRLVRDILYQAMERPEKDREVFLVSACGIDQQLRREVEELLRASAGTLGVMDKDSGAGEGALLPAGQILGHYRVIRLIGRGGMGVVYDAEDLTLHRRVALKLLGQACDRERAARRFAREARAASALNHPGIVTVYELGSAGGESFIAMEFVEGQTLREKAGSPLPLVLEWMRQVAEALAAAHKAGVVHRDLKPGNIMVTPAGQVKVLDFGLARHARDWTDPAASQDVTMTGELLGTPAYMSPEQALGEPVDHLSDIFSFGAILYEMACGRRPFEGRTPVETLARLFHDAPAPPRQVNARLSPDLAALIEQCMQRRPEARPATMSDVAEALRNLSARAVELASGAMERPATDGKSLRAAKPRWTRWAGVALTLGLALVACLVMARLVGSRHAPLEKSIRQFTHSGAVSRVAISTDGENLAYVDTDVDKSVLWTCHVSSGECSILLRGVGGVLKLLYSQDGRWIYFGTDGGPAPGENIFRVAAAGGPPAAVVRGAHWLQAVTADQKQIVYLRDDETNDRLVAADAAGGNERTIVTRYRPDRLTAAALSPDDKTLACWWLVQNASENYYNLVTVPLAGGTDIALTSKKWPATYPRPELTWLPDGSGVAVVIQNENELRQIFLVGYPRGAIGHITNDVAQYYGLSIAGPTETAASIQDNGGPEIWIADGAHSEAARQLTFGAPGYRVSAWLPDGRLVASGQGLWIIDPVSGRKLQIPGTSAADWLAAPTPDGRTLFFNSRRSALGGIWRMGIDGSGPARATQASGDGSPRVSQDGRWVVYAGFTPEGIGVWRMPVEGGAPERLSWGPKAAEPVVSPDGKWVATIDPEKGAHNVNIFPIDGGQPVKTLPAPPFVLAVEWSPDGKSVTYSDGRNLWNQPLDGSAVESVTRFISQNIVDFRWSRDGRLALSRSAPSRDVVLIQGYRQ